MKIIPVQDRVLLKRVSPETMSPGGVLYLPPTSQEKTLEGVVLAVGPGKEDDQGVTHPVRGIKAGDRVLFAWFAGTELKQEGEDCILLRVDEILAVLHLEQGDDPSKPLAVVPSPASRED